MTLDELLNKSKPAGVKTTATKSTTSKTGGSALDRLVKDAAPVAKPKSQVTSIATTTPEVPIAPITQKVSPVTGKIETLSQGKDDTRPIDTTFKKIVRAITPHFLEKELGIAPEQVQSKPLTTADRVALTGNELTRQQLKKDPSSISAGEYLRRGISFGNELDPTVAFSDKGDVSVRDLPEPTTRSQKTAQLIGNLITMKLAQPFVGKALSKIPGVTALEEKAILKPFSVGYPLAIAKAGVEGGLFGLITKNNKTIAQNALESAGTFAAFEALAYPIVAFFKPVFKEIGTGKFVPENMQKIIDEIGGSEPVKQTLWFRNPKNGNQFLRVDYNGRASVVKKGSEGIPANIKDAPVLTDANITAFEKQPSMYEKLKNYVSGKLKVGETFKFDGTTINIKPGETNSPIDELLARSKPAETEAPVARETPKVDVKPSEKGVTYEQASKLIQQEGGFSKASSRPALNRYAADELASSLGMSAKSLYDTAQEKNFALKPFLEALDKETETEARLAVQQRLIKKLEGEAIPRTDAEALSRYYDAKLSNDVKEGKTVSIGGDDMKAHFNEDYDDANHPIYSKAAFQTYQKLLSELPGNKVALTGGGAGVGKTEIVVNNLKDKGDIALIYDSNLSSLEGAKNAIKEARDKGKEVDIYGIIADLDGARSRTIMRENKTGRGISDKTFANGHAGFPETIKALIEEGIITPDKVHLLDLRKFNNFEDALAEMYYGNFSTDPLELVKNLGYNRESITKDYAKTNYNTKTGKRISISESTRKGDVRNGKTKVDAKRQGNKPNTSKSKGDGQPSKEVKTKKYPTIHPGGKIKTKEQLTKIYNKANVKENASLKEDIEKGDVHISKTPEEFEKRIEQLNKLAQSRAILRRTGGLPKKARGVFRQEGEKGNIRLQDETVSDPKVYFSVLAHELGHALEYHITGTVNKDTLRVFGSTLSEAEKTTILNELKEVTKDMVGAEAVKSKPGYYHQKTELLARFLQRIFENPERAAELAPTAMEHFERSAIEHPMVQEFLDAINNNIDKGQSKIVFLRDMKQTYEKLLGKRVGTMVWNDEVAYRAMKERGKIVIERLMKEKFKGIKDSPELLFRVAESIKYTTNDAPVFGTRDFANMKNAKEMQDLLKTGYKPIMEDGKAVVDFEDGVELPRYARDRYTPEQAEAMYKELSPEGKKLIREFTARKEEAKDLFNRDLIKTIYKVKGDLEGWVHHYFEDGGKGASLSTGSKRFKFKQAGTRKQRKGAKGYVEDLQKAMTKALTELETEKQWNEFIETQFARVTKPIAKGAAPDTGWVEVQGNLKRGVGTSQENKMVIIGKDGKGMAIQQPRYQMPISIYKRYKLLGEVAEEASTAVRVMNSINRYWRVNILFHPGSAATNFISGGIQYGTKILTDFYTELLTGSVKFKKTRRNLFSMITVLTPKGWQEAPDWVYGGDLSNYYGQFGREKAPGMLDKSVDKYADKTLKLYGAVERYWKKVIATAENAGDLKNLENLSINGFKNLTDDERRLLSEINSEIDLFAYDYDNVPMWMENYQQSAVMQTFKPFLKYPYKYSKHVSNLIGSVFDRTLPWQERVAKILAISTMISLYAYVRSKRKEKQKTEEVPETAPTSVSTRGRLFIGTDKDGNEIFTRVAKYPFVNLTEAGFQFAEGNSNQGFQSIADMVGGIAPVGKIALLAMGVRNEYEQYVPGEVLIADNLATFVPGTRILADIARYFDPYQRTKTAPFQSFTSLIPLPTDDEDLRQKLRGNKRYIKNVPLEGSVERQEGDKITRTTTDLVLRNYKPDVLLGLFAGIYRNRIDPDVAKAFIIRKKKNDKKKKDK